MAEVTEDCCWRTAEEVTQDDGLMGVGERDGQGMGELVLGLLGLLMGVIGFISTLSLLLSPRISSPVTWSYGFTPKSLFSHSDWTIRWIWDLGSPAGKAFKLVFPWSSSGGATQVTGSLITPQVRRMGPEALRGLTVSGLTTGMGFTGSIFFPICLSRALRLCVTSPYAPRLKSKQDKSRLWLSPKNFAICGLDRNFFPHGLQWSKVKMIVFWGR